MTVLTALTTANAIRWNNMHVTRSYPSVSRRLVAAKQRYQTVAYKTGVPWFIIAVIHERESDQSWMHQLAQGDPLNKVSVHIPRGRGPFATWEDGAYDALVNCAPYAARWKDWSAGGSLCLLEQYNGLGYFEHHDMASPYIFSGSDQYRSGKYVRDGVFDPHVVDVQPGCAVLLKEMMAIDPTIEFKLSKLAPPKTAAPSPKPSIWASIFMLIGKIAAALTKRH